VKRSKEPRKQVCRPTKYNQRYCEPPPLNPPDLSPKLERASMNDQPLNMLTPSNKNNDKNSTNTHQLQQMEPCERQSALASLFSSLSSFAGGQQLGQTIATGAPQRHCPLPEGSIAGSIQTVMAAAMMQHQQNQHTDNQHRQRQPQLVGADNRLQAQLQLPSPYLPEQSYMQDQHAGQQASAAGQQRINYCTICNKELCNKYFMKTHMLKMHGINLEMEQSCQDGDGSERGPERAESADKSRSSGEDEEGEEEREANLEKERGKEEEKVEMGNRDSDRSAAHSSKTKSNQIKNNSPRKACGESVLAPKTSQQSKKSSSASPAGKQTTSVMNGFAGNSMGGVVCDICNKELCSKYFLKVHKQNTHGIMTDYQDASQVIYPFAAPLLGPSPFMAAPPLTPNMSTPVPFLQPNPLTLFANAPQQQQQIDTSTCSKRSCGTKRLRSGQTKLAANEASAVGFDRSNETKISPSALPNKQLESVYRLIIAQQQHQFQSATPVNQAPQFMPFEPVSANPLGALMCFGAMGPGGGPFGASGMSPAMIVDNILRNQHLFNRTNCSAVGGTSKVATIATGKDKNNNEAKSVTSGSKASKDSAGNSRYFSHYTEACPMCDRRFKSIKWLKTHMMNDHKQEIGAYMQMMTQYLYASKSQQMAAAATMAALEQQQRQCVQQHQHESLQRRADMPTNCSELETLQHQQFQHLHQRQQQQANVIIDQKQFKPGNAFQAITQSAASPLNFIPGQANHNFQPQQQHRDTSEFAIDARCRHESLSPDGSYKIQSPVSPTSRTSLNFSNNNSLVGQPDGNQIFGFSFDLSGKLASDRPEDSFLLSRLSRPEGPEFAEEEEDENTTETDQFQNETVKKTVEGAEASQQLRMKTASD